MVSRRCRPGVAPASSRRRPNSHPPRRRTSNGKYTSGWSRCSSFIHRDPIGNLGGVKRPPMNPECSFATRALPPFPLSHECSLEAAIRLWLAVFKKLHSETAFSFDPRSRCEHMPRRVMEFSRLQWLGIVNGSDNGHRDLE